jgi:hypothetical protein
MVGTITDTTTHCTSTEFGTLNTWVSKQLNTALGVAADITSPAAELAELQEMADRILIRVILQKNIIKEKIAGGGSPGEAFPLAEFATAAELARLRTFTAQIRRNRIAFADRVTGEYEVIK